MIDAHCHLYDEQFAPGELPLVIGRAKENGVTAIICNGGGVTSSRRAVELAQKYDEVWAAVGIHPEEQSEMDNLGKGAVVAELSELARQPKVVAIGEAGLDYYETTTPEEKEKQIEMLQINIDLASQTGLPLVLHNRNADQHIRKALDNFEGKVQLHCFVGDLEFLNWAVERKYYISLGGIITFKNAGRVFEIIKHIPEELLLVETDSPYLSPEPKRGARNEPSNVKIVIEAVAKARSTTADKIGRLTTRNAVRLFNLPEKKY